MASISRFGPPSSDPHGRFFPPVGAPEYELLEFRDRIINPWSMRRNFHMGRIALSMAYFLGDQWQELDYEAAFDGVRGAFLRQVEDEWTVVKPVTNKCDSIIESEVIALVKRKWEPRVTATSNDPSIKAAAQVANDRLKHKLKTLAWPEKRHQLGLHFACGGTSLLYSSCDKSYMNLRPAPAPDAVACINPECETKLYSREVPVDTLRAGVIGADGSRSPASAPALSSARDVPPDPDAIDLDNPVDNVSIGNCPTCQEPSALQPYTPTPDEAATGVDVFGRPLGVDEPLPVATLEVDLPFEFHPQNAGLRVAPDTLRRWGRRKIRSLEWGEERYPHLIDQIQPQSISELLYGDPLLGGHDVLSNWSAAYDSGIFDNHFLVDEVVEEPSFRHPLGRYIVAAKDIVLEDSDLYEKETIEEDGEPADVYVARVQIGGARCKIRPGDFWGTTLLDHHISKQNRLNGLDSQIIESRLRNGSPNLMMPADMWPQDGGAFDSYGPGGVGTLLFLQPSLQNPQFSKPEVFGGELMPNDVYMERDRIIQDFKEDGTLSDPGRGIAPKNVGTTSGLQLLVEQDERTRSLREDELVGSVEKSWKHILEIEWVKNHNDEDEYRVKGPNKTWKIEQYRGSFLKGQNDVEIERGSFVTPSLVQREAAREGLADKVIVIDGPVTRRRLAEMYGLDSTLNEDTNNQVDHAERVLVDFRDKGLVRVQDMIDDPFIHYQVLGTWLRTEEGERAGDEAGWDEISRAIAGWEDELVWLVQAEARSLEFYQGRLSGEKAAIAFAKATDAYEKELEIYHQQKAVADEHAAAAADVSVANPEAAATTAPLLPTAPPSPPPAPMDIPVLMQDRLFGLWSGMLKNKGIVLDDEQSPTAALTRPRSLYVQFRALVAAYKMTMTGGGVAPVGVPAGMPAPGSGATMLPSDAGAPIGAAPGAGAGAGAGAGPVPAMQPTAPMPGGGAN